MSSLTCEAQLSDAIPSDCKQVVLVIANAWDSPSAELRRFSRSNAHQPWLAVGDSTPVLIGEHGLGWAAGLGGMPDDASPRKKEGDRRSPAGVFELTAVLHRETLTGIRMPLFPITPTTEAIDDPNSRYYNQIVDRRAIAHPDWHSSEKMGKIRDYTLCVAVGLNPARRPGGGSCVFLHIWSRRRAGTAGCTALRYRDLRALAQWLDPAQNPLLIQAPREAVPLLPPSLRFF